MKITKTGQLPEEEVFEARCNYCKTEIEFERKEAKFYSDQREGDYLSIDCPLCRKQITVTIGLNGWGR